MTAAPALGRGQRGATAVEFALISSVFFALLLGAGEMGRVPWVWNAAAEATRYGARVAAVCDLNDPVVKQRVMQRLAVLTGSNVSLTYQPAGCTASTCQSVTLSLTGYAQKTYIPFVTFSPTLPPFTTLISREYLSSAGNPACQ